MRVPHFTTPLIAVFLFGLSCQSSLEYVPTVRAATSVVNEYSVDMSLSVFGLALNASEDLDSADETMFAIGGKLVDSSSGAVNGLVEVVFSSPSVDSSALDFEYASANMGFESSRIAVGGRYYTDDARDLSPFLSTYIVMDDITATVTDDITYAGMTIFERGDSEDIGLQVGLSLGIGLEKAISENGFFDVSFSHLSALQDAASAVDGVSHEYSSIAGWTLNIGVGYSF